MLKCSNAVCSSRHCWNTLAPDRRVQRDQVIRAFPIIQCQWPTHPTRTSWGRCIVWLVSVVCLLLWLAVYLLLYVVLLPACCFRLVAFRLCFLLGFFIAFWLLLPACCLLRSALLLALCFLRSLLLMFEAMLLSMEKTNHQVCSLQRFFSEGGPKQPQTIPEGQPNPPRRRRPVAWLPSWMIVTAPTRAKIVC